MFFTLFNWLLNRRKIPYCFAVLFPIDIWSFSCGFLGFFLVLTQANFTSTNTETVFISSWNGILIIAGIGAVIEAGILRIFDIRIENRIVRLLNDNIINGHLKPGISVQDVARTYQSLKEFYGWINRTHFRYISMVVFGSAFIELLASRSFENVIIVLIAGVLVGLIAFMCGFPMWEMFMSPLLIECKEALTKNGQHFNEFYFLSLKIKSKFFIILIGLVLGIMLVFIARVDIFLFSSTFVLLIITGFLSSLIFGSIYQSFTAIEKSARDLSENKRALFFSGSTDKEIIDLSRSLNIAADKIYSSTKELKKSKEELEKFYKLTVGRELKMAELKKKNKELEIMLKK